MSYSPTGSYPTGLTSPTDKRIGDAFPIIEEVYKHLPHLKYIAENANSLVAKQIELRGNTSLQSIEWAYQDTDEWFTLIAFTDLTGGIAIDDLINNLSQLLNDAKTYINDQINQSQALASQTQIWAQYAVDNIHRIGYDVPVAYSAGLVVNHHTFTVDYNGVLYSPLPSKIPFTTGAWDAAQWYPIQNLLNQKNLLVFDTYVEASAAAATLPDGQRITVEKDETRSERRTLYIVQAGGLVYLGLYGAADSVEYDGGTAQDVLDSAKPLASYSDLRAYTGRASIVRITASGVAGCFRRDDASSSADNGGTIIVDASGRRWHRIFSGAVLDKWFGAVGDMVADDTSALQAAINYCLSFPLARELVVSGMCRISGSLNIDRLVDTTTSEFHITGIGTSSGFYANSTINIFDSTLPMVGVDPQSEFVTFNRIRFEAGPGGVGAYTLTRKFLRIKFRNCYWHKIRLVASDTYLQSFYFSLCNVRRWPGVWCVASHAFDTHFDMCISEFGASWLTNFPSGGYSLTFRDGCHEGSGGGLVGGGGFRQLVVDGMYMEQNATPNIALNNGATNYNVSVTNNQMMTTPANAANANFWDVVWGPTIGADAGGNRHENGRIHDNSSLPVGGLLRRASSDTAAVATVRTPSKADGFNTNISLVCTLGGGTLNYARFTRLENLVRVEFSFTFPSVASGSPAALYDLPLPAADAVISGIVDSSDYSSGPIRIIGGTGFAASNSPVRIAFASDAAGTALSYTALSGKKVVGQITYRV